MKVIIISASRDGTNLDGARFDFKIAKELKKIRSDFDILFVTFVKEIHNF